MLQYVVRRLLLMVPTLLGVTLLVRLLLFLGPGDPAVIAAGMGSAAGAGQGGVDTDAVLERFRERWLLDEPFHVQYLHYLGPFNLAEDGHRWFGGSGDDPWGGLLVGDLGNEMLRPSHAIAGELLERLKVTVPLAIASLLLSYLLALPFGIHAAVRQGSPLEVSSTVLFFVLYAIPTFWAGLLLQIAFGRTGLDLLPVLGIHDKDAGELSSWGYFLDLCKHLILPVVTFSYAQLAYISRQMRVGVVDVIAQDYVRTARAKGLSEKVVVLKHVLRNSLIPVITLLASVLPILVGGAIIVESVFDLPGMGRYALTGLLTRDYNVVMATTIVVSVMTVLGFLVSDILYAVVDPRIRYD